MSTRPSSFPPVAPAPVCSAAAITCLERAERALLEAGAAGEHTVRYASAHVAALRTAAAVLAVRTRPHPRGERNAWVLLTRIAPELAEWAAFFAAGAAKRAAAEAGSTRAVTEREADDLVRDSDRFLAVIEQALGLAPHVPFEEQIPWRAGRSA